MCKYRAGAEGTDKMDLLSVLVVLALQQAHRSFLGWTLWVDQMPHFCMCIPLPLCALLLTASLPCDSLQRSAPGLPELVWPCAENRKYPGVYASPEGAMSQ